MKLKNILVIMTFIGSLYVRQLWAQDPTPVQASSVQHPEWTRRASIYEVNVRQFTREGTFAALAPHLPRLKALGADILWLMPINPIGQQNRKGTLGSYYSVRDYRAVNPEFGTLADLKSLVREIHAQGMYVILDWVANHCAWDNPLTTEHPEWFTKDSLGHFVPPVPDWHDVIDLNYDQPGLRQWMIESMAYWVHEADVDGFRCDVAGMVPMDFWNTARVELEQIKPVFLLAEDEQPRCHEHAFDMTYSWSLYYLMRDVWQGKRVPDDLAAYFTRGMADFPPDAYRMHFTDNHDENSWNGTVFERLGKSAEVMAVLTLTAPGMPLVYSGQETGLNRRLSFFEKDSIEWKHSDWENLYTTLLALKHRHPALWNGSAGGAFQRVKTSVDKNVLAFVREKDGKQVLIVLNLSKRAQKMTVDAAGDYVDVFDRKPVPIGANAVIKLKPWGWRVLEK